MMCGGGWGGGGGQSRSLLIHSKSERTKKWKKGCKKKISGTQQIDRYWNWMKRWLPPQMKNRTKVSVNGRFWDQVYQWVYRHNECS